jgi:nitroreductase
VRQITFREEDASIVANAIKTRRSVRAYLPKAVDSAVIERILEIASRAPSGGNLQPWKVHVLTGEALTRVTNAMCGAFEKGVAGNPDYQYYPDQWRSPYAERRRRVGLDLYRLTGVLKGDTGAAKRQHGMNFGFFGAPVGLVFTIDDDLGLGSWIDYGMFLQNVMVVANVFGLDTCPQAAVAGYPDILRAELKVSRHELILCGMALGYADLDMPANQLSSQREPVNAFATFHSA